MNGGADTYGFLPRALMTRPTGALLVTVPGAPRGRYGRGRAAAVPVALLPGSGLSAVTAEPGCVAGTSVGKLPRIGADELPSAGVGATGETGRAEAEAEDCPAISPLAAPVGWGKGKEKKGAVMNSGFELLLPSWMRYPKSPRRFRW